MARGIFRLKYRDTRPVLQVTLYDPAPAGSSEDTLGPVHDLTGSTSWFLHILLSDGTKLRRPMTKVGADAAGTLEYAWIATDWDAGSAADAEGAFTVGGLVTGPTLPLAVGTVEHRMEYEVLGPASARMTFPNDERDNDILRISSDIGQG